MKGKLKDSITLHRQYIKIGSSGSSGRWHVEVPNADVLLTPDESVRDYGFGDSVSIRFDAIKREEGRKRAGMAIMFSGGREKGAA